MAKDDYHVIVFRILSYLYKQLKTGEAPDPDMLRANPRYAPWLKQRILGERGHLSNEACAEALLRLTAAGTGTVLLGHLSGENNTPELALRVSTKALAREDIRPGRDLRLSVALRDQTSPLYTIRERNQL